MKDSNIHDHNNFRDVVDNSDNSINNSYNNYYITNNYKLTNQELNDKYIKEKSKRYGLAEKCGNDIKVIAILTNNVVKDKRGVKRNTLLNIVDLYTGEYLSDHLQLFLAECDYGVNIFINEKDFVNNMVIVEIYGRVEKYGDNTDRCSIEINSNEKYYIRTISDNIDNLHPKNYQLEQMGAMNWKYIDRFMKHELDTAEIEKLVQAEKKLLNNITRSDKIPENFIYNFILNNYTASSSQFQLYKQGSHKDKMNYNHYLDISYIIAYLLKLIEESETISIIDICTTTASLIAKFIGMKTSRINDNKKYIDRHADSLGIRHEEVAFTMKNLDKHFKLDTFGVDLRYFIMHAQCYIFNNIYYFRREIE